MNVYKFRCHCLALFSFTSSLAIQAAAEDFALLLSAGLPGVVKPGSNLSAEEVASEKHLALFFFFVEVSGKPVVFYCTKGFFQF